MKAAMAIVEKQVVSLQEAAKRGYEKTQKLIDQAIIERDTEEAVFRAQSQDAFKLLEVCEAYKNVSFIGWLQSSE